MNPDLLGTVYLVCFLIGGTLMLLQTLMGVLGLGGGDDIHDGHDVHDAAHDGHDEAGHDHGGTWLLKVLSVRALVAGLTFFGLAGLATGRALPPEAALAVAAATGGVALVVVAFIMRSLARLQADGTVRMERAVGQGGTVYLTVPGSKGGRGKVMLNLQNRTVECQAVTSQEALPTGTKVVVTAVLGQDTVEVIAAP
jgi:membrane protein implicated in regulation of membrane protease activity